MLFEIFPRYLVLCSGRYTLSPAVEIGGEDLRIQWYVISTKLRDHMRTIQFQLLVVNGTCLHKRVTNNFWVFFAMFSINKYNKNFFWYLNCTSTANMPISEYGTGMGQVQNDCVCVLSSTIIVVSLHTELRNVCRVQVLYTEYGDCTRSTSLWWFYDTELPQPCPYAIPLPFIQFL